MNQYLEYIIASKDKPIFNDNIGDDGIIDDCATETVFCPINAMQYNFNGYVRIQADNGATDVEIRLTVEQLKSLLKQIEESTNSTGVKGD